MGIRLSSPTFSLDEKTAETCLIIQFQDLLNLFCIMFERTLSLYMKWLSLHYPSSCCVVHKVFVQITTVRDDKDQASRWPYKWQALGIITGLLTQITYNGFGYLTERLLTNFISWTFLIFKLPHDTLNGRSIAHVIAVPG